jgi:hypothetical protein
MKNKSTAARLIASAIQSCLDSGTRFGLLAKSLPPFDLITLYKTLNPQPESLRLALLGFNDIDDQFPSQVARDVETAISWRNDPKISAKLVVILNPTASLEKTHSLSMLEPFTDQDLRRSIYLLAEKEAKDTSDYTHADVWRAISKIDQTNREKLPLVATQVIDFYEALSNAQEVGLALPYIGLLPDPELSKTNDKVGKLRANYEMVEWLSNLDSRAFRTLARAVSGDKRGFRQTFGNIKAYSNSPSYETLQSLSLGDVRQLREAPKAPQPKATSQRADKPADVLLVDQLLKIAEEKDAKKHQTAIHNMEEQARRVSRMFYREDLPEDFEDNVDTSLNDEENEFVVLSDWMDGEETGQAEKFKEDRRHPLGEPFQMWLTDVVNLAQIFNGKTTLYFRPLRPFDQGNPQSLHRLFQELDAAIEGAQSGISLVNLFHTFDEHRRFLLHYQELFLYYPQYAIQDREIRPRLDAYLKAYQELCQRVHQVCRRVQEHYPDAVERTIAQFLALDTILVRIDQPDQDPKISVLLTSLHPLHLWKWVQLSNYLSDLPRPLTPREQERVRLATSHLPTILNTFLIHHDMYQNLPGQVENRLVLAGEIDNPENGNTIGIPYYQPIAEQGVGVDGLQQFAGFLRHFLILYPPAQLGLTLVLIDPPRLAPLLAKLVEYSRKPDQEVQLEGAKVLTFWTKTSTIDDWQSKDEDTLQLFREDPRWMLYIDGEVRTLEEIHAELIRRHLSPHLILLCDPSDAVACSTFRTVQDDATPFGVPIQITYDQISDTLQVLPASTGGVFDLYTDLRHILSGDLHRTILGVGTRGAKLEDLRRLIDTDPQTHWLAILDRPQGTLELPVSLGRRLLWLSAGSRNLVIQTTQRDWELYWQKQIEYKLSDWRMPGNPGRILNGLLELVPLFANGMLDLIQKFPISYVNILDEVKIAEMLGVMKVLNWYRQDKPGFVLLPIGGQDFDDWYGDEEFDGQIPPYYLGFWLENDQLKTDIISVHTTNPDSPMKVLRGEFDHLALFAQALEPLFEEAAKTFILTPLRRTILRDHLITTVFTPSAVSDESLLAQSKRTKAQWATTINDLFTLSYKPSIKLLRINVDFDAKSVSTKTERIYDEDVERYECYQVSLPGDFLEPDISVDSIKPTPSTSDASIVSTKPKDEQTPKLDDEATPSSPTELDEFVSGQASRLRRVLEAYGLPIAGVDVSKSQVGPRFIRYWVQLLPPAGRLSEIQKYAEDIAREMGSNTVPFIDNIPGERFIGIDLARDEPVSIPLLPALKKLPDSQTDLMLIAAGQNPAGEDIQLDLTRLPHMLVAGQTGSGKTVFLSSLIMSLAWRHTTSDLQLMLVDTKQMDFGVFENLPNLQGHSIYTEPDDAIEALQHLLEIERPKRTELIRQANCPNNLEYNRRFPDRRLPWLVVVIDEFADLILSLNKRDRGEFEKQINRLAATGRAVGIHLVIATQRPATDVITGTIKANITARISFRLPSQVDSRTILDRTGAENLLGQGDMLVSINNNFQRLQGYFASYDEINSLLLGLKG